MKTRMIATMLLLLVLPVMAQDDVTVVSSSSEAGDGLDLAAVGELFKECEDLESFENRLNDPDRGINNLDLNEDGYIDYIRVLEEVADDVHVIVLQATLGEDDYQDVATIELEKTGDDSCQMQIQGNTEVYGSHVYYAPAAVSVYHWPIVVRLYGPAYRPWRSAYYWGYYPPSWHAWHPVSRTVYRTRHVHHRTFVVTRTPRIRVTHRVNYTPRSSVVVKKRTTVRPASGNRTVVKKTTVKTPGKTVEKTTVKGRSGRVSKTTTTTKNAKKTTVKARKK